MDDKTNKEGKWLFGCPSESNWYWVRNEYGVISFQRK